MLGTPPCWPNRNPRHSRRRPLPPRRCLRRELIDHSSTQNTLFTLAPPPRLSSTMGLLRPLVLRLIFASPVSSPRTPWSTVAQMMTSTIISPLLRSRRRSRRSLPPMELLMLRKLGKLRRRERRRSSSRRKPAPRAGGCFRQPTPVRLRKPTDIIFPMKCFARRLQALHCCHGNFR